MPTLIHELLRSMREERQWSRSQLSRQTIRQGQEGVGEKTIQSIEENPGRVPEARLIEDLAAAFGVPPETFYEYPIAFRRRATREAAEQLEQLARRRRQPPDADAA